MSGRANEVGMDAESTRQPCIHFEIIVEGQLDEYWLDWFDGMCLENFPNGTARLTGELPDQPALQGVINRVFDLNLKLISVKSVTSLK